MKYRAERRGFENSQDVRPSLAPGIPGVTPFSGQPYELGASPMRDMMPAYRAAGPLSQSLPISRPGFPAYGSMAQGDFRAPQSVLSMPPQAVPLTVMPGSMAPRGVVQSMPPPQMAQVVQSMPPPQSLQSLPPMQFRQAPASSSVLVPAMAMPVAQPLFMAPPPAPVPFAQPVLPVQVMGADGMMSCADQRALSRGRSPSPVALSGVARAATPTSIRSLSPPLFRTPQATPPLSAQSLPPMAAAGIIARSLPAVGGSGAARIRSSSPGIVLSPPVGARMLSANRIS